MSYHKLWALETNKLLCSLYTQKKPTNRVECYQVSGPLPYLLGDHPPVQKILTMIKQPLGSTFLVQYNTQSCLVSYRDIEYPTSA
jgi:hypothetical protein